MKTDFKLGTRVRKALVNAGVENPIDFTMSGKTNVSDLERDLAPFCENLGLDLKHPSTKGTPHRLAKMYKNEIFTGLNYENFPACMEVPNDGKADEIVLIRNIELKSLCEHHFMPIIGSAHVAYIPSSKLVGLSKINRVVEFFGRRPQLQERLTEQIATAFIEILGTKDVAVIIEAEHFCVKFRGCEDHHSDTVTSKMSGRFKDVPEARAELMALINRR
tara:strand:+ start:866 stop:1522 length:657 start_codon:yes stop_codon:yes gene_type:complete